MRECVPYQIVQALALLKKCAAKVNIQYGLPEQIANAVAQASEEIVLGTLVMDQSPFLLWQTDGGETLNRNMNQMIAKCATKILGGKESADGLVIKPEEHVNMQQPSHTMMLAMAMRIAIARECQCVFLPNLQSLLDILTEDKEGRLEDMAFVDGGEVTHPASLALRRDLHAHYSTIQQDIEHTKSTLKRLCSFVDRGQNDKNDGQSVDAAASVHDGYKPEDVFLEQISDAVAEETGLTFAATEKISCEFLAPHDAFVGMSSALNRVANSLVKISHSRAAFGSDDCDGQLEVKIRKSTVKKENVGDARCKALSMLTIVCAQVMGNHVSITLGGSHSYLLTNFFELFAATCLLKSMQSLGDAVLSFVKTCIGETREFAAPTLPELQDAGGRVASSAGSISTAGEMGRRSHQENGKAHDARDKKLYQHDDLQAKSCNADADASADSEADANTAAVADADKGGKPNPSVNGRCQVPVEAYRLSSEDMAGQTLPDGVPFSSPVIPKKDPCDPQKRTGYLTWDDYFMSIAFLSAQRSKDPHRQVGACIVSKDRIILGIGYNGFPRGCHDDDLPWSKTAADGDPLKTKYPYVCHAEMNAILNRNQASADGQRLYVTMFPCNECAKIIIQAGIAEVVYFQDKRAKGGSTGVENQEGMACPDPKYAASHHLLTLAKIKVSQHKPPMQSIMIHFE